MNQLLVHSHFTSLLSQAQQFFSSEDPSSDLFLRKYLGALSVYAIGYPVAPTVTEILPKQAQSHTSSHPHNNP